MALAQQLQLQGSDAGARDRARRLAGSPALSVVGRRLLSAIVVVWGVTLMTFLVLSTLPNDTAQVLLGLHATPADVVRLNHTLGLDEPFPVRYWHWLVNVLHGNLGTDLEGASVNSQLAQHLPVTMELLAYALVASVVLALIVAVLAARKPSGIADQISTAISLLGLSAAPYVVALLLIIVASVQLNLFPVQSNSLGSGSLLSFFQQGTLPAASLGFPLFAIFTRLLRADLLEQMQREDYIVTAKAKGVSPWQVLVRHALRNSLYNLITVIGLNLGQLIGALAIIETIFSVPGIGSELLTALGNKDIPLIEGITLVFAVVTVLGNLLADLMYAVLDPRIRHGRAQS
jgi:peptide/nickel transport system permease protein